MEKLNALRIFLKQYAPLAETEITTDFIVPKINSFALAEAGNSVTSTERDVLGNRYDTFSYSAVLYAKFTTLTEFQRVRNSVNFENLAEWIYENEDLLPPFGNFDQDLETLHAENAVLFDTDKNGEAGTYQLQITRAFTRKYSKGELL